MKPIAPNTLIQNRYLIVHLIGKGGMGEVYLAVDQRLGSAIALKRTFFSDDVLLGNAFEREARTLARLRHPVLPKVSDHFTDEGTQYLVMEHISGEDMSKRLEAMQKPFPLSWVLFWADQLLDSLNYLHTHEPPIIHRDIKPQNLKLTDENHIVLLDFGLSKNSSGGETRAATSGSIVGYTPHYAPMEQIRGAGTDARSDIYSLSATLYQILTANVPPDALTRADSLINGLPDPITPISDINPEVSKAVSDVIIKGMSISLEQRYKTAREMQKALRDAYAQMQNEMSASPVQRSNETPPEIKQTPPKTEISAEEMPIISHSRAQPMSVSGAATESPAENKAPATDFDATIRYDSEVPSPAAHGAAPRQADIKTEVFLAGGSSAITAAQEKYDARDRSPDNFSKSDFDARDSENNVFQKSGNFDDEDDFSASQNYSPDVTTPLISFGNQTDETGKTAISFDSGDRRGDQTSGATFTPTASKAATDENLRAPSTAPVRQKSKNPLAIIGGIAALLFLAASVGAIGWFVLRDRSAAVENATPNPTSETTFSTAPTAAPTIPAPPLETVTETNINSDTNESGGGNSAASGSANINGALPTTAPIKTPSGSTAAPLPTRNTLPTAAPRNTAAPRALPSIARPQPTPKPTARKTPPPIAP